ncbi:unnamed protein product [Rhizoctonia solani]|uniref:Uncharacterized protein n=1 Tax=Rhizoctonia solani TaxID=456999 RepID=A0A8H3GR83_9AGAM|nr:unnamed protein product [Rhizoctonia solani]
MKLYLLTVYVLACFWDCAHYALAMPAPTVVKIIEPSTLHKRKAPYFPVYPPSCPKCQVDFDNINSCADASAALTDPQSIILNPVGFYDLIKCACTDTFQSAFPQCVHCFIQTNQTSVIDADITPNSSELPAIVTGMRQVCALSSTLLGGVASADPQVASSTPSAPTAVATSTGIRVDIWSAESYFVLGLIAAALVW